MSAATQYDHMNERIALTTNGGQDAARHLLLPPPGTKQDKLHTVPLARYITGDAAPEYGPDKVKTEETVYYSIAETPHPTLVDIQRWLEGIHSKAVAFEVHLEKVIDQGATRGYDRWKFPVTLFMPNGA